MNTARLHLDPGPFEAGIDEILERLTALQPADDPGPRLLEILDDLWTTGNAEVAVGTADIVVPLELSPRGRDLLAAIRAGHVEFGVSVQHGGPSQESEV